MSNHVIPCIDHRQPLSTLFWKNWRELRTLAGSLLVFVFSAQLVLSLLPRSVGFGLLVNDLSGMFGLACVFPIVTSLTVPVLAIGQERLAGTWNWTSSFPVSPLYHFVGWALVWLGVSLTGYLAVLAPIPFLVSAEDWSHASGYAAMEIILSVFAFSVTTMIITTVAMLWFRDPLTGLAWSGATNLALQFAIQVIVEQPSLMPDYHNERDWYFGSYFLATLACWLLFGSLGAWLYVWRWRAGQWVQTSWSAIASFAKPLPQTRNFSADDWRRYSDEKIQVRAGQIRRAIWFLGRNQLGPIVALCSLALCYGFGIFNTNTQVILLFVFASFCGISLSYALLLKDQYCFFSVRGQMTWQGWDFLIAAQTALLVTGLAVHSSQFWYQTLESTLSVIFVCSILFWCMSLGGLLCPNVVAALGVGTIAANSILFIAITTYQWSTSSNYGGLWSVQPPPLSLHCAILGLAWILFWVVARGVGRHWLVFGRSDQRRVLAGFGTVALLTTFYFASFPFSPMVCIMGLIVAIVALR